MALGVAGYVGFNDDLLTGVKPPLRLWSCADTGVDLAAGILCCANRYDDALGLSGHLGLSFRDRAAIIIQVERQQAFHIDRGTFYEYDTFLGGKIGSTAGVVTGAANAVLGLGILIWLISTLEN